MQNKHGPCEGQTRGGERFRPMSGLLILGLVFALFFSLGVEPGVASGRQEAPVNQDHDRVLYVTGAAREQVPNSNAQISLGVEVRRESAEDAHREAAERAERVVSVLRSLGVRELSTTGLQLRVEHRTVDGSREIAGYVAVNTVEFVTDVDAAGEAIDQSVSAGATRIQGITLRPDPALLSEAMKRVERAAARDGVARADRVLVELGLERKEISSVRLIDSGYISPQDGRGGMLMRAEAFDTTPVEAGTSSAEARVELRIRY